MSIESNHIEHEKLDEWFRLLPLKIKRLIHMRGTSWVYKEKIVRALLKKERIIVGLKQQLEKLK